MLYCCKKCGSFVSRDKMKQHAKKCGGRRYSTFW